MCTFNFAAEETTSLVVRNLCKLKLELDTETVQSERLTLLEVLIRMGEEGSKRISLLPLPRQTGGTYFFISVFG